MKQEPVATPPGPQLATFLTAAAVRSAGATMPFLHTSLECARRIAPRAATLPNCCITSLVEDFSWRVVVQTVTWQPDQALCP
jgi:hypothetical protein